MSIRSLRILQHKGAWPLSGSKEEALFFQFHILQSVPVTVLPFWSQDQPSAKLEESEEESERFVWKKDKSLANSPPSTPVASLARNLIALLC